MMGAFLTWQPKAGPSKSLFFDSCTEETQTLAATSTDFPVEEGVNISDHVHDERDQCVLEVFVSNQPIYDWNNRGGRVQKLPIKLQQYKAPLEATPGSVFAAVGGAVKSAVSSLLGNQREFAAQVMQWPTSFDAVGETLAVLESLKKSKQLVNVVIPSRVYENMLLEQIQVTRDAGTGDGAKLHLEFKQMRIVEAKIVTAPIPTEIRGATTKAKGAQAPKDAKAETTKKSVAKGLIDALIK